MTPENQITVLKALEAIKGLSNSIAIEVLLSPETGIKSITENIKILKYKLSIIEGVLIEPKVKVPTSYKHGA